MSAGDLVIRDACAADLPALVRLLMDDDLGRLREEAGPPLPQGYLDAFAAIDRDPCHRLLVAERDGAVIGTLQLSFLPGLSHHGAWRAQIEAVRIARTLRGQGHGRALIARAIAEARARGCRLVQLTSDKARSEAHRFYGSFGFVPSHEGFKLVLDPGR
ncbi:GNAT family N-acetyltransferase [Poseidonocella sp. HB161398]|uniref:GNAT family N-acetyltransferase n=1 Tax=Poseidonocella sp. HB161398 TaxID=2320855 RepID=UPI001F0F920A|nr:GNAT family N-acetyltransferase [Poseidonocella sp. HB161398]